MTELRKPDIIFIDKKERKGIIINIAVPVDVRVAGKERENMEKYQDLETQNGRSGACFDRIAWKFHKRIWWVD